MLDYVQPAIVWPDKYMPGNTDNYCSNEVIVKGLSISEVWVPLVDTTVWLEYYHANARILVERGYTTKLFAGANFMFDTFGFNIRAKVEEYLPPFGGEDVARLAWSGSFGEGESLCEVYHAWLLQNLPNDRVRILTQETQIGAPAIALAKSVPNKLLNGHQAWLEGVVEAAFAYKAGKILKV